MIVFACLCDRAYSVRQCMKSVQSPSSVLQLRRCDPRRRRGSLHQAPGRAGHRASHAHPRSLGGSWARSNGSPGMPAARGICHPPHHLIWLRIEPTMPRRAPKSRRRSVPSSPRPRHAPRPRPPPGAWPRLSAARAAVRPAPRAAHTAALGGAPAPRGTAQPSRGAK